MCGISAVCGRGPAASLIDTAERMHRLAAHRGPDGEGWLALGADLRPTAAATAAALREQTGSSELVLVGAFRWLRIQDSSPQSNQPMTSHTGRTWVLFNGEIYNHEALRRELTGLGHAFRTRSDTEVLLVAYEAWGAAAFPRLNGIWGAVLIDLARGAITLTRDRFGVRPLFYRVDGGRLLIGSTVKQLLSIDGGRPRADRGAIQRYFAEQRLGVEQTFFADVRAVPPAASATAALTAPWAAPPAFTPYWTLAPEPPHLDGSRMSLAEASREVEGALEDAVDLQSVAVRPVGALLSGGLDSSVVSTLLAAARHRRAEPSILISVVTEAIGALDERPYMRAMAAALAAHGAVGIEAPIDAAGVSAALPSVTWHQDEPLAGVALVAQYRAYEAAAAAGLKVVHEGTGSDEMFGGYPRHQLARLRDDRRRRGRIGGAVALAAAVVRDPVLRSWMMGRIGDRVRRRVLLPRAAWMTPDFAATPAAAAADPVTGGHSLLARMLRHDVTGGNVPAVLGIGDRNAMAHGIESRVPFLDHRLVELAFRLPDNLKTRHGTTKIVLREVARRRLPAVVANRRARIGFGVPIAEWMRGPLRAGILECARSPEIAGCGVFRPDKTVECVAGFLDRRHEDGAPVWRVLAFAHWLRAFTPAI